MHLNDLTLEERQDYLLDMSFVGDAMMKALKPTRVNYEILGNKNHFLHAHLFQRYEWEDESVRYMPVWCMMLLIGLMKKRLTILINMMKLEIR